MLAGGRTVVWRVGGWVCRLLTAGRADRRAGERADGHAGRWAAYCLAGEWARRRVGGLVGKLQGG